MVPGSSWFWCPVQKLYTAVIQFVPSTDMFLLHHNSACRVQIRSCAILIQTRRIQRGHWPKKNCFQTDCNLSNKNIIMIYDWYWNHSFENYMILFLFWRKWLSAVQNSTILYWKFHAWLNLASFNALSVKMYSLSRPQFDFMHLKRSMHIFNSVLCIWTMHSGRKGWQNLFWVNAVS